MPVTGVGDSNSAGARTGVGAWAGPVAVAVTDAGNSDSASAGTGAGIKVMTGFTSEN